MKKIIFSTVLLLSLILMNVACGQNSPIIGTWSDGEITCEFIKNGEFIFSGPSYLETGKWRDMGNNKIELTREGSTSTTGSYVIKGNDLILTLDEIDTLHLTKK